jgi:hypothetical protein
MKRIAISFVVVSEWPAGGPAGLGLYGGDERGAAGSTNPGSLFILFFEPRIREFTVPPV